MGSDMRLCVGIEILEHVGESLNVRRLRVDLGGEGVDESVNWTQQIDLLLW